MDSIFYVVGLIRPVENDCNEMSRSGFHNEMLAMCNIFLICDTVCSKSNYILCECVQCVFYDMARERERQETRLSTHREPTVGVSQNTWRWLKWHYSEAQG